ncbi:phage tail tape measure protein [Hyphomicrobium sp. xq]|uniref:Phage tail tape measure protein n=1 Tax=Hyphomicrobium album TaxID=2665159 RepID=A0A6I3KGL6_9HYPH|nr:phage tail tape measure protein [Hyphomicrobium album]MTD93120.1 phage tail tape measure protein [Hyphomicrobium album]
MSNLAVQILLQLRDQLTAPARTAGRSFTSMSREIQAASRNITGAANGAASGVRSIGAAATASSRQVAGLAQQMNAATRSHGAMAARVGRNNRLVGLGAGLGLAGVLSYGSGLGRGLFNSNLDFAREINNTRAVMTRSSIADLEALEKKTIELSTTTTFSATTIAKAFGEMGAAGYEAREAIMAMPTAIMVAQGAREPLEKTAETLIGIKNQFGLSDADLPHVADVLAETQRQTFSKLEDLREAFKMAGPISKQFGVPLELTAAAVGLLSQQGIKGSLAGTGFRRMMSGFVKETKPTQNILRSLGLDPSDIYDKNGHFKDLPNLLEHLQKKGVTAQQAMAAFGDRGGPILAALLSGGVSELRRLTRELETADGVARKMADDQMAGLPGVFDRLRANVEAARLSIGRSGFAGDMIAVMNFARDRLTDFVQMPDWVQRATGWAAMLLGGLAAIALPAAMLRFALAGLGTRLALLLLPGRALLGVLQGLARAGPMVVHALATVARVAGPLAALFAGLRLLALGTGVGAALLGIVTFYPAIEAAASGFWSGLNTGWQGSEAQQAFQWLAGQLPILGSVFGKIKSGIDFLFDLGSLDSGSLTRFFDAGAAAANKLLNPLRAIRELLGSLPSLSSLWGGGKAGGIAGAAAGARAVIAPPAGGVGRFATLPSGLQMPPSIAGPTTNNIDQSKTVNVGGVSTSVSVSVQTNADPGAIGSAVGSAVGAKVRGATAIDGN